MIRENRAQPAFPLNTMEAEQSNEWKLTRAIRKFNKINPVSHAGSLGARSADFLIEDAKKTVHEFTHPELGAMDMLLGALLIGVPVGAAYSVVKLPEWIHAGRQWFEKNVIKISDEIKDWLFLDTLEGYATGAQWARQTMGAVKAKR